MQRTSIYSKSFSHKNPIPNACRVGNILASGLVVGKDPATGKLPETLDGQCACLFEQIRLIAEAGGARLEDIVKITFYLKDRNNRAPLNQEWLKAFPDPQSRPARQAMEGSAGNMDEGKLIVCDFLAVLPD
jgi:2-iminobutanoate/2-iminopropanoate deaminase